MKSLEKPRRNPSQWPLALALAVSWTLPLIGLFLPAGRQESLWHLLVVATVLIAFGVLVCCVFACVRKHWRRAVLVLLYFVGCVVAVSAATLVSTYKGGTSELHVAAQRYRSVVNGTDRQSVVALFEGSRVSPAEFGPRGPEEIVDAVDNFTGGFGDVIIVYYREGRTVGKCLHFLSDPRPNFLPVHPSPPLKGHPCY